MKKYYSIQEVKDKMIEIMDNVEKAFTSGQTGSYDLEDLEDFLYTYTGQPTEFVFVKIAQLIREYTQDKESLDEPSNDEEDLQIINSNLNITQQELLHYAENYIKDTGASYSPQELVNYWLIKGTM